MLFFYCYYILQKREFMKKDYARFTLRLSKSMLYKLGVISQHNTRTKNKEIEHLLNRHIAEYERLYGEIR